MTVNGGYALLDGVAFRNNTEVQYPVEYDGGERGALARIFSDDDITVLNTYGDTQHKSTPVAQMPAFVKSRMLVADDPWFLQTIQVRPAISGTCMPAPNVAWQLSGR